MGLNQPPFFSIKKGFFCWPTLKQDIISALIRIFSQLSLPLGKEHGKSELCHPLHDNKVFQNLSEACLVQEARFLCNLWQWQHPCTADRTNLDFTVCPPGYPELFCSQSFQFSSYYSSFLTNIMPNNILNGICIDFQSSEKWKINILK